MRRVSLMIVALVSLFVDAPAMAAEATSRPPNIVMIVGDDLGWRDLGCTGNRFHETPRIDQLAREGTRFSTFYAAAPVCSPTRAALLTGNAPARIGITDFIPGHWRPFEKLAVPHNVLDLPAETVTVAEALGAVGYRCAHFGKWHLGGQGSEPADHGFQASFRQDGRHSIRDPRKKGPAADSDVRTADYLATLAESFIAENKGQPFYLQVSHAAPHIPLNTTPELLEKYTAKPKIAGESSHPAYAGLVEELDTSVGRVLAALEANGLADETIVVFTSDNGGLEREMGGWPGTVNDPLRNEKGSLYEGGVRIPCIIRWPGKVAAGRVVDSPAITMDLLPTLLDLTGQNGRTAARPRDGVSLANGLTNPQATLPDRTLYWHYPHYHHSSPASAVRSGQWKLIQFFEHPGTPELYDLAADPEETRDVAGREPERVKELLAELARWRHDVQAQMPTKNPAYDPKRVDEWWNRGKLVPTEPPGGKYPPPGVASP